MNETLTIIRGLYENAQKALSKINHTSFQYRQVLANIYLPLWIFILLFRLSMGAFRSIKPAYLWAYAVVPSFSFALMFGGFLFLLLLASQGAANNVFHSIRFKNINKRVLFCAIPAFSAKIFSSLPIIGGPLFLLGAGYSIYLFWLGFYTDKTLDEEKLPRFFGVLAVNTLILSAIAILAVLIIQKILRVAMGHFQ